MRYIYIMKAWSLSQPAREFSSSSSAANMRRPRCASTAVCILMLATCILLAYSAFFSDQLHLPLPWGPATCHLCRSAALSDSDPYPLRNLDRDKSDAPGPVPSTAAPTPTDLSHIVFVIGASSQTWDQRRPYIELWWRPNHTRGNVWLDNPPTAPWPPTCPPYSISRDMAKYGNRASASRIAAAVVDAYQMHKEKKNDSSVGARWFVMGDDDTVFFVDNLVRVLQKYDHRQTYYVGMPSESVEQDVMHNYGMAYGGGGFAISYAAVAELAQVMDACLDRYASFYGSDQRVQACLAELGIPLTREPGFHQVDVRGDVYGILAAHPVAPLVSLHHLDYVMPISRNKPSQLESLQSLFSAYQVDPARILQQAFCYDAGAAGPMFSVSVSWGYSVQVYPRLLAPHELETALQTFKTWRSFSDGPFIFNTRPLGHPCVRPFVFSLDRVLSSKTGTTLTQYMRAHNDEHDSSGCNKDQSFSAASRIQKVMVFAPKMDPLFWKQAPRRHCCMTARTKWGRMLEVRIKYCRPGQSTMPPPST